MWQNRVDGPRSGVVIKKSLVDALRAARARPIVFGDVMVPVSMRYAKDLDKLRE